MKELNNQSISNPKLTTQLNSELWLVNPLQFRRFLFLLLLFFGLKLNCFAGIHEDIFSKEEENVRITLKNSFSPDHAPLNPSESEESCRQEIPNNILNDLYETVKLLEKPQVYDLRKTITLRDNYPYDYTDFVTGWVERANPEDHRVELFVTSDKDYPGDNPDTAFPLNTAPVNKMAIGFSEIYSKNHTGTVTGYVSHLPNSINYADLIVRVFVIIENDNTYFQSKSRVDVDGNWSVDNIGEGEKLVEVYRKNDIRWTSSLARAYKDFGGTNEFVFPRSEVGVKSVRLVRKSDDKIVAEDYEIPKLLRSYTVPQKNPAWEPLKDRTFLYDQSLAIITAVILEDQDSAERWVEGLLSVQQPNGQFPFSVNRKSGEMSEASFRTGSQFWNVYSLAWFLNKYPDSYLAVKVSHAIRKCLNTLIDRYWVRGKGLQQYAFRAGRGWTDKKTKIFDPDFPMTWCSTEHNIDAVFALLLAGRVLNNEAYTSIGNRVLQALQTNFWDDENDRAYQGITSQTEVDSNHALDVGSWYSILMRTIAEDDDKAEKALLSLKPYRVIDPESGARGFTPYLRQFGHPKAAGGLWTEGTAGAILALSAAREDSCSLKAWFNELLKLYTDEGILYITIEDEENELLPAPSLASTAWAIISAKPNGFWNVNNNFLGPCAKDVGEGESKTIETKLIAHWLLNEGAGCSIENSVNNSSAMLEPDCHEETWWPVKGVLEFDGNNDHVDLGLIEEGDPLQLANGGTVMAWFLQRGGDRWQRIVDKSSGGNGAEGYALVADPRDRSLWLSVDGASYKSIPHAYELNAWVHVAAVITKKAFKLYVNGNKVMGTFRQGSAKLPPNVATSMRMGTWNHAGGREFNGFLDDIRIFKAPLLEENIQKIMDESNLHDNLVAHYSLDDGQGCSVSDQANGSLGISGRLAPHCPIPNSNAPLWSTVNAVLGSALEFDGDNDHVDLGLIEEGDALQLAKGGTVMAWFFQRGGDRWQRIVDKSSGGGGANGYALFADPQDRSLWLSVDGASYKSRPHAYELNAWTHVAAVITVTAFRLYVNGEQVMGAFRSGSAKLPPNVATSMRMGTWNHAGGREFNGFLDDIRIFRTPLQGNDIQAVMDKANSNSDLVAHYPLDNREGCSVSDQANGSEGISGNLAPNCQEPHSDAPLWSTHAVLGSALEFDGDNDHVNLGFIEEGDPLQLTEGGTVMAWFYQRKGDRWQRILDKSSGASGTNGYALFADPSDRTLWLSVDRATFKSIPNAYELNAWTHVAAVITATTFELYVNGEHVMGAFRSGTAKLPPNVGTSMRMGTWNHAGGREFNGFLDDIRIFRTPLQGNNIQAIIDEANSKCDLAALNGIHLEMESDPIQFSSPIKRLIISKTLYEDGEDGTHNGWTSYGPGWVSNIPDQSGNRVIETRADLAENTFRLGLDDQGDWNNTKEFTAYFSVLMTENTAIYFRVGTSLGEKYLCYTAESTPGVSDYGDTIIYGLGIDIDGHWQAIVRSLANDLQDALPDTQLLSVKDMYVRGDVLIDDVMLLKLEE